MRIALYIDVDGVLNHADPDAPDRVVWRKNAKDFLEWAAGRFECYFLTAWPERDVRERILAAWRVTGEFRYADWHGGDGKTSAIQLGREFLWIDDSPSPHDLVRLRESGKLHALIHANPGTPDELVRIRKILQSRLFQR